MDRLEVFVKEKPHYISDDVIELYRFSDLYHTRPIVYIDIQLVKDAERKQYVQQNILNNPEKLREYLRIHSKYERSEFWNREMK